MNDAVIEYIRSAEDDLTRLYQLLELSHALAADVVRREIATVIVQLYGLRHCQETGLGFCPALAHPIVTSSGLPRPVELSFRCGADQAAGKR